MPTPDARPLRRDAQRNVERIRRAAVVVFREHGLDASHEAIAREADVSIGTVYRRFPDRLQLIDSLFEVELARVESAAETALAMDDPWSAVSYLVQTQVEMALDNLGLQQLLTGSHRAAGRVHEARGRLEPLWVAIVERARDAGVIRADAVPQDIPVTLLMLSTLTSPRREIAPELWRRYLALILDALRPQGAARPPLPDAVPVDVMNRFIDAANSPDGST